jgi:hypothetical protein
MEFLDLPPKSPPAVPPSPPLLRSPFSPPLPSTPPQIYQYVSQGCCASGPEGYEMDSVEESGVYESEMACRDKCTDGLPLCLGYYVRAFPLPPNYYACYLVVPRGSANASNFPSAHGFYAAPNDYTPAVEGANSGLACRAAIRSSPSLYTCYVPVASPSPCEFGLALPSDLGPNWGGGTKPNGRYVWEVQRSTSNVYLDERVGSPASWTGFSTWAELLYTDPQESRNPSPNPFRFSFGFTGLDPVNGSFKLLASNSEGSDGPIDLTTLLSSTYTNRECIPVNTADPCIQEYNLTIIGNFTYFQLSFGRWVCVF